VTKIFADGKGAALGKRVAQLYLMTTILAVINGISVANMFSGLFTANNDDDDEEGADVEFRCPDGAGKVTLDPVSGRLFCLPKESVSSFNLTES
jgi:hypothetical protein